MDFECLGQVIHHELKDNGDSVRVTQTNKDEYIKYVMHLLIFLLDFF